MDDRHRSQHPGLSRLPGGIQRFLGLIALVRRRLLILVLLGTGCLSPYLWAQTPISDPLVLTNDAVGAPVYRSRSTALVDSAFRISIPLLAEHTDAERDASTALGQPVATLTLERVQQLRREEAFGLALALVEQAGKDDGPDWLAWEQERWAILKAADQKTRLAARLQATLPSLQGDLKVDVTLEFARLLVTLGKPRQSQVRVSIPYKPENMILRYVNLKFLLIFSLTFLPKKVNKNISKNFKFPYRNIIFVGL